MSESAAQVEALERIQVHLNERIRAIQSEIEQSLEKAQQAERDAASFCARSLASGDSEGEKLRIAKSRKPPSNLR
jgi:hypothetical protein